MQRAAFCTKRGNKLTSPKHKLHIFQVKTSTVQDKDLLGNRCHFRHLQHFCSSRAAILLTFLEDNAQNSPSYFSSNIFEILLSYSPILKTMASDQTREANKNMWVICRKRGQHSLVYCAESQIELKTGVNRSQQISISLQCRPQLLLVRFQNLAQSIFKNENSALKINVSHFGKLLWQQWQSPCICYCLGRKCHALHFRRSFLKILPIQ